MSDYTSKSALIDIIMQNVVITTEEGLELRGEIVDLIKNQPTLDEKEIIRKAFERVVERLEELSILARYNECPSSNHKCEGYNEQTCAECFVNEIMNTVKEEGGIE